MPPTLSLIISLLLIIIATTFAYHKLENEKEELEKKLASHLEIKVLSANSYSRNAGQQENIPSWHSIIRDVEVSITNSPYSNCVSVKEVTLEKLGCYKGARSLGILPRHIQEQWKWTLEKTNAMPDNVYLRPGETITGSYLFSEVVRGKNEEIMKKINTERDFRLVITDSMGNIYRNEVKTV